MSAPVFILGTQRSGTTLLTRMLSAHSSIFVQNELELAKIFRPNLNKEQIVEAIKEQITIETGHSLDTILTKGKGILWGLKDPQLTEHLTALEQFLPESKFIIIVRDGRGVTNSYMENKWGLGTNAYYGALRWKNEVQQQHAFMEKHPDNCLYIRYEDLIDNLEENLRQICTFLGKDFEEGMLTYYETASYYGKQRENVHTFKKPDKKLAEKWRNKLSAFEVDVVEHIAGDVLKGNGYPLEGNPVNLSKLQLFYFKWHQKILGEIQIQYRWRKSGIVNRIERRKRQQEQA